MSQKTGEKKSGGALAWRLSLSAIIVPTLVGLFMWDHSLGQSAPVLLALVLMLTLRACGEATTLLWTRKFQPSWPIVASCSVAIVLAGWLVQLKEFSPGSNSSFVALGFIGLAFSLSVLVLFFAGAVRYREPGQSMETLGAELIAVAYVGLLISVTAQLRWVAGAHAGYLVLGSLVIAAKGGDIMAYTFGRLWGRRKMVPILSPGKTWMGAVGAVVGSGFGGWAWLHWGTPLFNADWEPCNSAVAIFYGMTIGVVGLIGDLCESLIKRDVGKKDAAPLLPGFGGLLDLLDSVLYAGPVAYLLWQIIPLATWQ